MSSELASYSVVAIAVAVVLALSAGVVLCRTRKSKLVLLCFALAGSLALLTFIVGVLALEALSGDWAAIADTALVWFGCAAIFSLVVTVLAIVLCAMRPKE